MLETESGYPDLNSFLQGEFGIGESNISLLVEFQDSPENETTEQYQARIADNLITQLKRKGALLTAEEAQGFYKAQFGLHPGSPPEQYTSYPGGTVVYDKQDKKLKVCLSPSISYGYHSIDYALLSVLEETVHWSQLTLAHRQKATLEDEHDAQQRILKLKDFLKFSPSRIKHIEQGADWHKKIHKPPQ